MALVNSLDQLRTQVLHPPHSCVGKIDSISGLCVSGLNAARKADAPRLLREKEDAQRAELAQRAAAEEEARRRWQQAQVTYTWWSYSYWYSWWYHR